MRERAEQRHGMRQRRKSQRERAREREGGGVGIPPVSGVSGRAVTGHDGIVSTSIPSI